MRVLKNVDHYPFSHTVFPHMQSISITTALRSTFRQSRPRSLDRCPAGELRPVVSVLEPVDSHSDRRDQPEEHVDQVDPDGVLHALDRLVALGVFLDEEL